MSGINDYQQFLNAEASRAKMELPHQINTVLDYCEYSIRMTFNASEREHYLLKKKGKKELNKEFITTLQILDRQQKIQHYCMVVNFMSNFLKEDFDPPKSHQSNIKGYLDAIGYARTFYLKNWKQKTLRIDFSKHLMFAQHEQKIKSYDMRNYLIRKSNKTQIFCFVLEAINSVPPEKSKTVHIGFYNQTDFEIFVSALTFSIKLRQWEYYLNIFQEHLKNQIIAKSMSPNTMTVTDIFSKVNKGFSIEQRSVTYGQKVKNEEFKIREIEKQMRQPSLYKSNHSIIKIEEDSEESESIFSVNENENGRNMDLKQQEKEQLEHQIQNYLSRKQIAKSYADLLIESQIFEEPDVFEVTLEQQNQLDNLMKEQVY